MVAGAEDGREGVGVADGGICWGALGAQKATHLVDEVVDFAGIAVSGGVVVRIGCVRSSDATRSGAEDEVVF